MNTLGKMTTIGEAPGTSEAPGEKNEELWYGKDNKHF
jgi:hypothetical protein